MDRPAPRPSRSCVTSAEFSDFEEMEAALRDANVKLAQSKPGKFAAGLTRAVLDQAVLCHGWDAVAHLAHTSTAPGFLFGLAAEDEFHCNGYPLHKGTMLLCRPGAEHFAYSTAGSQWVYVVLPPDDLERRLAESPARHLLSDGKCLPVCLTAESQQTLRRELQRILCVLKTTPQVLETPEAAKGMEHSLLEAFLLALADIPSPPVMETARRARARIVSRAQEFLRAHLDRPIYMREVCAAASISERALRQAFYDLFGMSPNRCLKILRMNGARRGLRRADPSRATVLKVASQFGFWDMGRFAVEYRALFGESPSQTLRGPGTSSWPCRHAGECPG
jgi:AraC family transcriptional regulator, ethanolamine operon transcriptional activator